MHLYNKPINLTVRHLQMLVTVADLQSFSRAAERMGISQPAFSEAVRKIEAEVGRKIFDRTTRSLEVTADGRHIVATARELVRDFRIALESIQAGVSSKGPITIAALPTIVAAVMPSALKRFSEQFPDNHVAIHDLPQERALAMVVDGIADIGITNAIGEIDGLQFTELASDQFLAIIAKHHELQSKTHVQWKDLAAFPFIALSGLSSIRRVTDAAFIKADVAPKLEAEVEQIPSAIALVEAGYGVTALPSLAYPLFKGRNVVVRQLIKPMAHRRIGIVTLSHRKLSPAALLMANVLKDRMKILLNKPMGKRSEPFHAL